MRTYEFHAYAADEFGAIISDRAEMTTRSFAETAAAKAFAGRLAKRINGPVDIAFHRLISWEARYITTASPSEYHASGYRFERLVN